MNSIAVAHAHVSLATSQIGGCILVRGRSNNMNWGSSIRVSPIGGSPSPIEVSPNGASPIGGSPIGGSPNGGGPKSFSPFQHPPLGLQGCLDWGVCTDKFCYSGTPLWSLDNILRISSKRKRIVGFFRKH